LRNGCTGAIRLTPIAPYGAFAKSCRAAIDEAATAGDADTADIITAVSRAVDKDLWFLAPTSIDRAPASTLSIAAMA
jgi:hypothetical protein